ncbi:hypothetical protein HanRHA438_Chr15g0707051 [Helianthus annuus]|nr:hypothetical protein HanIR_Chr15g0755011 [Helianthus annuus]KAJ0844854.1 hypothetical protein HanRHA438_Chr15g0707051 [Helianthus annuus]
MSHDEVFDRKSVDVWYPAPATNEIQDAHSYITTREEMIVGLLPFPTQLALNRFRNNVPSS